MTMVSSTHWTSNTPIEPGWYWFRGRSHRALMLRIDDYGLVDSHGEFDGIPAAKLTGDWWTPQIQVPD